MATSRAVVVCIGLLGVVVVAGAAWAASDDAVEAISLLGRDLVRPALDPAAAAPHLRAIEALEARLADDPTDADGRIWLGRRLAYLGRYREALAVFDAGVRTHPQDARFLRHRGHRLLTLRRVEEAAADFEAGLRLAAGQLDQVEEDGLPNLFNRPTSSLKGNLLYHLGLARHLLGDAVRAGEAFAACAALADNPDMLVAATYWRYLALRRQGRHDEAAELLATPQLGARLIENDDYQRLLRLFGGAESAEDLLGLHAAGSVGGATLAFGVAAWHRLEGRPTESDQLLRRIVDGDGWAAFGFLAAEAELARLAR